MHLCIVSPGEVQHRLEPALLRDASSDFRIVSYLDQGEGSVLADLFVRVTGQRYEQG